MGGGEGGGGLTVCAGALDHEVWKADTLRTE